MDILSLSLKTTSISILMMNIRSFIVVLGEIANFAAYTFAPAILVTPLGALSIIFRYGTFWHCTRIKPKLLPFLFILKQ